MPSWLAEYFTVPSIHRPELHEYHEGLTKSTIQVCGDFLNRISPALHQKFEGIMTTSIHKSLRRLRINWLQVQLKNFKTNMVSLVGEEMKTWGLFLPYMAAVVEDIDFVSDRVQVVGPDTPEEVDLPPRQGGIWTHSKCLNFLVSRLIEVDRSFYQNDANFNTLYTGVTGAANSNAKVNLLHARILVKQNWNKVQAVVVASPSRLIGFMSAAHAMTAGVMVQTTNQAHIADLKNRAAFFLSCANDVDVCMRLPGTAFRSYLIYRKGVFAGVLMHPEQISLMGSIHYLNEQAAEETFQYSKGMLRRNASLTPVQLLTKIERLRNTIKLEIMDETALNQTRKEIEQRTMERFHLLAKTAVA